MHLPFLTTVEQAEETELPEIVPIEDLSARALTAAAREIEEERPVPPAA